MENLTNHRDFVKSRASSTTPALWYAESGNHASKFAHFKATIIAIPIHKEWYADLRTLKE